MEQKLTRIAFRLAQQPPELLTAALKQIGRESMPKARNVTEEIHFVRVQSKRLRALLELMRPYISPPEYSNQKQCIKAVARELATIRDSHVLRKTLDSAADELGKKKRHKHRHSIASTVPTRDVRSERQVCRQSHTCLVKLWPDCRVRALAQPTC